MVARGWRLQALGSLAPPVGSQHWSASTLDRSRVLPDEVRQRVARYLEGCPVFLAWMEYTRDEIGGCFEVPGGSSIASDGAFYWRLDAVSYIRQYGIPVPSAAMRHFESREWVSPSFERDEYLAIYRELDALLGGGESVG